MDLDTFLPQVKALAEPLLTRQSAELVECTLRREGYRIVVRFLVETVPGVTLDQCAILNRQIGAALEAANLFEEPYLLEVASPGLDRPLATLRDYERTLGDRITVTSQENGRTVTQTGRLMHADDQVLLLEVSAGTRVTIPRAFVKVSKRVVTIR